MDDISVSEVKQRLKKIEELLLVLVNLEREKANKTLLDWSEI